MTQRWNISNATLRNNSAIIDGGAIYGQEGFDLTMENSDFYSNKAGREGGALSFGVRRRLLLIRSSHMEARD